MDGTLIRLAGTFRDSRDIILDDIFDEEGLSLKEASMLKKLTHWAQLSGKRLWITTELDAPHFYRILATALDSSPKYFSDIPTVDGDKVRAGAIGKNPGGIICVYDSRIGFFLDGIYQEVEFGGPLTHRERLRQITNVVGLDGTVYAAKNFDRVEQDIVQRTKLAIDVTNNGMHHYVTDGQPPTIHVRDSRLALEYLASALIVSFDPNMAGDAARLMEDPIARKQYLKKRE